MRGGGVGGSIPRVIASSGARRRKQQTFQGRRRGHRSTSPLMGCLTAGGGGRGLNQSQLLSCQTPPEPSRRLRGAGAESSEQKKLGGEALTSAQTGSASNCCLRAANDKLISFQRPASARAESISIPASSQTLMAPAPSAASENVNLFGKHAPIDSLF